MPASTAPSATAPSWLDLVRRKVEGLHYGQVHIVVHDRQVTQVECLERTRLAPVRPPAPDAKRADRAD